MEITAFKVMSPGVSVNDEPVIKVFKSLEKALDYAARKVSEDDGSCLIANAKIVLED